MKNKILKKILGILGYKLINKEVIKNERLVSSKSYLKIESLLNTLFKEKKIDTIIQIGANDGIRFDILNNYIKKYKIKSLLVEPIKINYEKLKHLYIKLLNIKPPLLFFEMKLEECYTLNNYEETLKNIL